MRQDDYEIIVACIQHGAPALQERLVSSLNSVVEKSNKYVEAQRLEAEKARKEELAKVEEARKAKDEPTMKKGDLNEQPKK